jgi:predicted small secreted protein
MKTKLTKTIVLIFASLACASCGTIFGLGQDFQKMGEGLQKVAQPRLWRASSPAAEQTPEYSIPEYSIPE